MLSTFSLDPYSILIIVILNFMFDVDNYSICVLFVSGSYTWFVSSGYVFSCILTRFVIILVKDRYAISGNKN